VADWTSLVGALHTAALTAFGSEVTFIPQGGAPVVVPAILEATRVTQEGSPGVFGALFLRLAHLPVAPQHGDAVLIGDVRYTVFNMEADGQGGVTLGLQQA